MKFINIQVIVIITTGPNGEFARHHSMVTLALIQLDLEIVNAHVTGNAKINNMLIGNLSWKQHLLGNTIIKLEKSIILNLET